LFLNVIDLSSSEVTLSDSFPVLHISVGATQAGVGMEDFQSGMAGFPGNGTSK